MVYFSRECKGFYLSKAAARSLGIVSYSFPQVACSSTGRGNMARPALSAMGEMGPGTRDQDNNIVCDNLTNKDTEAYVQDDIDSTKDSHNYTKVTLASTEDGTVRDCPEVTLVCDELGRELSQFEKNIAPTGPRQVPL